MTVISLAEELDNLSKYSDGELILRNDHVVWNLYLVRSQLLYAINEVHRLRRWDRVLTQHCPKWNWRTVLCELLDNELWECQLLEHGLSEKQLSLVQANSIIRNIAQECLFDLNTHTDLKSEWKPSQKAVSTYCRVVSLSHQGIQSVLTKVRHLQEKWRSSGAAQLCPNLSPILQEERNSQPLPIPHKYLNGEFTLWDIAWQMEKSVTDVASSLTPLLDKQILKMEEIPDLSINSVKQSKPVSSTYSLNENNLSTESTQKHPLIACIDDSPVLTLALKKILIPAGYQVLSIPEPMRGFSQLIEHKPDLILLDLLLPNADGYSVCKFLRETPVFKNTPIIILTAQNTPIDRARAQIIGATEFLGKPPQREEVLQLIQKYLR
ncbi:response regulator [Aetokthonos hydrillicola]|jgi:chemotaxis family two-component system response regulator PixG|nr:response regulator [Aetokthonos hydrillicola]MBO3457655.1 response regulator [Aetokthonos hydrillicola CCALA 1050]